MGESYSVRVELAGFPTNPSGDINGSIGLVGGARDGRIGQMALKFSF